MINQERLVAPLNTPVKIDTIMQQRQLPLLQDYLDLLILISNEYNIWADAALFARIQQLRDIYLY